MNFTEKHKALLISVLISATLVLALFSFHLKQKAELITESYYELEPEKTPEEKKHKVGEMLHEVNVIDKMNEELDETQKEIDILKKKDLKS